jgi:DNA recombination protein RmuC
MLVKNAQEVTDLGRQLYERIAVLVGHWTDGGGLDKAIEVYSKSVATLESRVLVSARRLRDLKAAPEDAEIEAIEPVERTTRVLQTTALVAFSGEDKK